MNFPILFHVILSMTKYQVVTVPMHTNIFPFCYLLSYFIRSIGNVSIFRFNSLHKFCQQQIRTFIRALTRTFFRSQTFCERSISSQKKVVLFFKSHTFASFTLRANGPVNNLEQFSVHRGK